MAGGRISMRIDVIGAGSLGLLLAGRLIASGVEVRIWCRGRSRARRYPNGVLLLAMKMAGKQHGFQAGASQRHQ